MRIPALLSSLSLALAVQGCGASGSNEQPVDPDFTVGALVDLSGDSSEADQYLQAAILQGAQAAAASGVTIAVVTRDTQGDPATTAQQLQELLDQGIRVFVGLSSSTEAQAALPLANAAGALLVSTGSTAQTLAIPNDALYRLTPTNDVLMQAVLDLLKLRGVSSLVTVNRQDLGNQEESNELRRLAQNAGIALQPAISYPADTTAFSAVAEQVKNAVLAAGASPYTAVQVSGFNEVSSLFADCNVYETLQATSFYGSDGFSQDNDIISSAGPAFFSLGAGSVPSPVLAVPPDREAQAAQVSSAIGDPYPDSYSLNGYDALMIFADAFRLDPSFGSGGSSDRAAFVAAADGYDGLTGTIELDAAGDRVTGTYAFWGVCTLGGLINWYPIASWSPSSPSSTRGTATFQGCPAQGT